MNNLRALLNQIRRVTSVTLAGGLLLSTLLVSGCAFQRAIVTTQFDSSATNHSKAQVETICNGEARAAYNDVLQRNLSVYNDGQAFGDWHVFESCAARYGWRATLLKK